MRDGRLLCGRTGRGEGGLTSFSVRADGSNAKRCRFLSHAVASGNFIFPPPHQDLSMRSLLGLSAFVMFLPTLRAADDYKLGPDSERQSGVPEGKITQHKWTSHVFAGTERDY